MNSWTLTSFESVNNRYRSGEMTASLIADAKELCNLSIDLFESGMIPVDHNREFIKSLSVSYECLDYALSLPPKVSEFFVKFLETLLDGAVWTEDITEPDAWEGNLENIKRFIRFRVKKIGLRFAGDIDMDNEQKVAKLAEGFFLLGLCGVNCLYRGYEDERAKLSLERLLPLLRCLVAIKHPGSETDASTSSLFATARYLQGRVEFSLGNYVQSESHFREAAQSYLKKVLLIDGNSDEDHDSRTLAKRRYSLSSVFGLGYLYQTQGRLQESLDVCNNALPALRNAGIVMVAYANLIKSATITALNSSNWGILQNCIGTFRESLAIFEIEVGHSHYPLRAKLHIALAILYKVECTDDGQGKRLLFDESLELIEQVLNSEICQQAKEEGKNRRILADALNLKSYALRKLPEKEKDLRDANISAAISLADEAVSVSEGMKQIRCESLVALASAYHEGYQEFQRRYGKYLDKPDFPEGQHPYNVSSSETATAKRFRGLAKQKYFEVLSINHENDRLSATAYLRLAELELDDEDNPASYNASFYFERFKSYTVEHEFVNSFALKVSDAISRKANAAPFFQIATAKSLDIKHWRAELEEYLIEKALYKVAKERWAELPLKLCSSTTKKKFPIDCTRIHEEILASKFVRPSDIYRNVHALVKAEVGLLTNLHNTEATEMADMKLLSFLEKCLEVKNRHEDAQSGLSASELI